MRKLSFIVILLISFMNIQAQNNGLLFGLNSENKLCVVNSGYRGFKCPFRPKSNRWYAPCKCECPRCGWWALFLFGRCR